MMFVLATEVPNGAITTFTSGVPWNGFLPTPTINGRTRTEGFTVVDQRTVRFDEPPRYGDVVGFFVNPK